MARYLIKKIALLLISLWIVATLTFVMMHAIPGDPFQQEQAIPEEILQALRHHYGLDRPWYVQYGCHLRRLITWDLGPSFKYQGRSINEIIEQGFPVSLILGAQALALSILLGGFLGVVAAFKHLRWEDQAIMIIAVLGISIPSFLLATFLQYIFAMKLDLFPIARWGTYSHTILPAITLSALPTAFIARLTRANVIEIVQQDFILTAKAKGLGPFRIAICHVLRNALIPIIAYIGPLTANIITGSFAVEKIFGIPGLGQWFVMNIANRDYTAIMGITFFYAALLLLCTFMVDIFYPLIDPRISYG